MTTSTTPDGIIGWTNSDPASLVSESQAQANSIQTALGLRGQHNFAWATQTLQTNETRMVQGDMGYRSDTGLTYQYVGGVWRRFSSLDWIGYTPALSASGGAWSIGNGAINAQWRPLNGQTIAIQILVSIGSTTSIASGAAFIGLPTGLTTTSYTQTIPMEINSAGIGLFVGEGYVDGSSTTIQPKGPAANNSPVISNTTSTQLGNGSSIRMNGMFSVTGL